jgi:polyhydroxyalkanoate synthesis regulator phasin
MTGQIKEERRKKMMTKVCGLLVVLSLIVLFALSPRISFAGEVDILIEKMVEKGMLTKQDAESILKEIRQETAKQEKEKMKEAEAPQWVKDIPEWVKNVKFKGDFRLRYQTEDRKDDNNDARERGRLRLRLGAETKVIDDVKVGFGLASGSGDPRSTNQTFQDTFGKKDVKIDYAFAEYTPLKGFGLIGGKFHNPLYRPSDLLWDSDITPEGGAAKLNYKVMPELDLLFNTGFFILDERSTDNDPWMVALQPGLNWKVTKDLNLKLTFAYYLFGGVKDNTLDYSAGTNTRLANGKLKFDYDAPALSGEIGYKNPFGSDFIPYVGLFGEYVKNPDPDDEDKGYIAGLKVGHTSMKKFGDWSFKYSYRRLEKDAWLDVFPDSDFYGGATNAKGHEAAFSFGLLKNIWLELDYYNARKIVGDPKQTENLLQADLNFKF